MDTFIWIALVVVFLIVEAACPIHLVSIWFAAGALVAAVVSMLHGQLWLQILLFAATSAALLMTLRPVVRKLFTPKLTRTNVDAVVGAEGLVTVPVDNLHGTGQVKIGGMEWTARSADGQPLEVGTRVRVDKVVGVKVYVTALEVSVRR